MGSSSSIRLTIAVEKLPGLTLCGNVPKVSVMVSSSSSIIVVGGGDLKGFFCLTADER